MLAGLCAVILGAITGCGKKEATVTKVDPHSAEGVNEAIQYQKTVLTAALQKQDYFFIHRQMYYIETLADALAYKLKGDERKQRVDPILVELKKMTAQLDRTGGTKHKEATETMLTQLFEIFKKLDAEFPPPTGKK